MINIEKNISNLPSIKEYNAIESYGTILESLETDDDSDFDCSELLEAYVFPDPPSLESTYNPNVDTTNISLVLKNNSYNTNIPTYEMPFKSENKEKIMNDVNYDIINDDQITTTSRKGSDNSISSQNSRFKEFIQENHPYNYLYSQQNDSKATAYTIVNDDHSIKNQKKQQQLKISSPKSSKPNLVRSKTSNDIYSLSYNTHSSSNNNSITSFGSSTTVKAYNNNSKHSIAQFNKSSSSIDINKSNTLNNNINKNNNINDINNEGNIDEFENNNIYFNNNENVSNSDSENADDDEENNNKEKNRLRSNSGSSIRSIVRSFSTLSNYQQRRRSKSLDRVDELSQAAMSVITVHDALAKNEYSAILNNDTSNEHGKRRKLSQFISNAMKPKHTTKIVNMDVQKSTNNIRSIYKNNDFNNDINKDNSNKDRKVVRKTIIYVDRVENVKEFNELLKTYQLQCHRHKKILPPQPNNVTLSSSPSIVSTTDVEDVSSIVSFLSNSSISSSASILSTINRNAILNDKTNKNNYDDGDDQSTSAPVSVTVIGRKRRSALLHGLELREMNDGTMVWGVVKKEGRRKSFYAMSDDKRQRESKIEAISNKGDDDNSEEKIEYDHQEQESYKKEVDEYPEEENNNNEDDDENESNDIIDSYIDDEDSEEKIEQKVLELMGYEPDYLETLSSTLTTTSPPPIPKRSSKRQPSLGNTNDKNKNNDIDNNKKGKKNNDNGNDLLKYISTNIKNDKDLASFATTEVYYAPDLTLPNLLQIATAAHKKSKK